MLDVVCCSPSKTTTAVNKVGAAQRFFFEPNPAIFGTSRMAGADHTHKNKLSPFAPSWFPEGAKGESSSWFPRGASALSYINTQHSRAPAPSYNRARSPFGLEGEHQASPLSSSGASPILTPAVQFCPTPWEDWSSSQAPLLTVGDYPNIIVEKKGAGASKRCGGDRRGGEKHVVESVAEEEVVSQKEVVVVDVVSSQKEGAVEDFGESLEAEEAAGGGSGMGGERTTGVNAAKV